jgi:hypothetical protein
MWMKFLKLNLTGKSFYSSIWNDTWNNRNFNIFSNTVEETSQREDGFFSSKWLKTMIYIGIGLLAVSIVIAAVVLSFLLWLWTTNQQAMKRHQWQILVWKFDFYFKKSISTNIFDRRQLIDMGNDGMATCLSRENWHHVYIILFCSIHLKHSARIPRWFDMCRDLTDFRIILIKLPQCQNWCSFIVQ